MSYVRMNDLAGTEREATDVEKHRASVLADQGDKQAVISLLRDLKLPWEASRLPVAVGGWYSSTDVIARASTTWAERNPTAVTAIDFTRRMSDPAGATKTAANYWKNKVEQELGCDLSKPLGCVPWWVWAAGGTVVVGAGLLYFGGFISAIGNVAERMTRNSGKVSCCVCGAKTEKSQYDDAGHPYCHECRAVSRKKSAARRSAGRSSWSGSQDHRSETGGGFRSAGQSYKRHGS